MARIARVVLPGYPHHVTQRGNRRLQTFFGEQDYRTYRTLMAASCRRHQVAVWAYCLMPNHVHLVAVPACAENLARAIGEAHRRYALHVNQREGWRGHLWQERFASFVMDEVHLLAAVRYVEMNPVRAGMVSRPQDYPWSSAAAHLQGKDDGLVAVQPLLQMVPSWQDFLATELTGENARFRRHAKTGRPLGPCSFVETVEQLTGRILKPQRQRGR